MSTPAIALPIGADDAASLLRTAVEKISINPTIWIAVASYLYKKITEPRPLSKDDLKRYRHMCQLYAQYTQPYTDDALAALPPEWKLDDANCPVYSSEFEAQASRLQAQIRSLDESNNDLKPQLIGIVSKIEELFTSLSKRWPVGRYRVDGFESMFCNELAMWLIIDLPRYPLTDKATAEKVRRRIDYCREMQETVLIYRGARGVANPINILRPIIQELKTLHKTLYEAHQAATYTDNIKAVNNRLIFMVRNSFQILYLMLRDAQQREFQVIEFLTPCEGREKMILLKSYLLGDCIAKTCEAAGIISNDYINTKPISLDMIDTHLGDIDLTTLKITDIPTLGLDSFMWKKDHPGMSKIVHRVKQTDKKDYLENKAPSFLTAIMAVHRSILELYSIRAALKVSIQLNGALGDIWLFNTEQGKAMFEGLMASLTHAYDRHWKALSTCWSLFYTESYAPFALAHYKDNSDDRHDDILFARGRYKDTKRKIKDIVEHIRNIRIYGDKVREESPAIEEKKSKLIEWICQYLARYVPEYNLESLRGSSCVAGAGGAGAGTSAGAEFRTSTTLSLTRGDVMSTPATELALREYPFTKADLAVAWEVQSILNEKSSRPASLRLDLPKFSAFCDDFHARICDTVLTPYQRRAKSLFVSLLHGEGPAKHRMLQEHQSRLIRALQVIDEKLLPYKRTGGNRYAEQLHIINTCLSAYLYRMCRDMDWHTGGLRIYFTSDITQYSKPGDREPLLEHDGRLRIVSDAIELAVTRDELEKTKDKLSKSEVKATAMEVRAIAAETSAAASEERAVAAELGAKRSADAAERMAADFALMKAHMMPQKNTEKAARRFSLFGSSDSAATMKPPESATARRPT